MFMGKSNLGSLHEAVYLGSDPGNRRGRRGQWTSYQACKVSNDRGDSILDGSDSLKAGIERGVGNNGLLRKVINLLPK
jgi:hypothetical protein